MLKGVSRGILFSCIGGLLGLYPVFADELSLAEPQGLSVAQVTLEYPEPTESIAALESVFVPGGETMTYCSLIARTNLQRFTGLPLTKEFGEDAILQGDAIRLIEEGLQNDSFVSITRLGKDMKKYYGTLAAYSLFDLYIYTPSSKEEITYNDYIFQGHRVVALFAEGVWRIMDPLRGTSASWQSRDVYKQYLHPSAQLFVYDHVYTFSSSYLLDFSKKYTGVEIVETTNLASLLYTGIIVAEFDKDFMPVASSFLKSAVLVQSGVQITFPLGVVATSTDSSPFNIGLLHSSLGRLDDGLGSLEIALGGKEIQFSLPVSVKIDTSMLFGSSASDEYIITKKSGAGAGGSLCNDYFDEQGKKIVVHDEESILITLCRTGVYTITPVPLLDKGR